MSGAEKTLTLEEFLKLPETKPASEYHEGGRVLQKPMPKQKHSVLQREMIGRLRDFGRDSGHGQVFPELRCTFGGRSIVPDVCYFVSERIQRDESGELAEDVFVPPDFAPAACRKAFERASSPARTSCPASRCRWRSCSAG